MVRKKKFLQKRCDRAIAIILSFKDQQCDPYLPPDVSKKLRQVVLDNVYDVCDLALDMVSDDIEFNEVFWERMEHILEASRRDGDT